MASLGKPHILTVTEVQRGIQAFAAQYLGDASRWTSLVTANNLSPPYFTLYPSQIYGPAVAVTTLSTAVSADATALSLPNQPQSTNTLYLSGAGTSGLVAEAVSVRSYDGTTFQLSTPLKNAYNQGAQVQLFSTYDIGYTNVLLPGDVIYLPISQTSNFTLATTSQLTDVFGSDIANPVNFNGDVSTVSGVNTLQQRMGAALQTLVNSLPLHTGWGSLLPSSVGRVSTQTQWSALIRECLLQLPEVSNVSDAVAVITGNQVLINATVYTSTSDAAIQLQNLPLTVVG